MSTKYQPTEPRRISLNHMIESAIELMENTGKANFSVRKLAQKLSCDPMTVLYHVKSKEGLYRAMANHLTSFLAPTPSDIPWQQRLIELAKQYRLLALKYPHTFTLMQRFLSTGTADFKHIEMVYNAIKESGVRQDAIVAVSLGWYATVIGLAMSEISGLLSPATVAEQQEIEALPENEFPILKQSIKQLAELNTDTTYHIILECLHNGIRQYQLSQQN